MSKREEHILEILRRLCKAGGRPVTSKMIAVRAGATQDAVRICMHKHSDLVKAMKHEGMGSTLLYEPKD